MLSDKEQQRYQRQLLLPDFGASSQLLLKQSKVLVVGAGGLGGPVAYYLAAAGVGHLVICDNDVVEESNLNRQILHSTSRIGLAKSDSADASLKDLNPEIVIESHNVFVDEKNIAVLAKGADIIVDCLDNITTRMHINAFAVKTGTPIMHGGIEEWTGQITLVQPGQTLCLNCLFEGAEDTSTPKPVLGAVAGVIGTTQALETLKFLMNKSNLAGNLLYFDGMNLEWTKIPVQRNNDCPVCGDKNNNS